MSVTVTDLLDGPYTPNGATVTFPFSFKAISASEVAVLREAGGVRSTVSSSQYSVVLNAGEGGSVTFASAPAAGSGLIYVSANPDFTQQASFSAEGPFTPKTLNNLFDRAALRDLHLKAEFDRAIKAPLGQTGQDLPTAAPGQFLVFDGTGKLATASGTGTDAGLRTDLSKADLVTTTPLGFSAPQTNKSTGASLVSYAGGGATSATSSVEEKLRTLPRNATEFYDPADGNNIQPAIQRVLDAYSAARTGHPGLGAGAGTGVVELGRGQFPIGSAVLIFSPQGAGIKGHGLYSTTLLANDTSTDSSVYVENYAGLVFEDFTLFNQAGPGTGIRGFFFNSGVGGGGNLRFNRVHIEGYHTCIQIFANPSADGDKSLYTQVTLIGTIGWSNSTNTQAMGHTFIGLNGQCTEAMFLYGGAGPLRSMQGTYNIGGAGGAIIKIPEAAGSDQAGFIELHGDKIESHGTGNNYLLNATGSKLASDAGGSRVVVRFQNVVVSGGNPPDPATNRVIAVGDASGGSDRIIVQSDGSDFDGVVEIGSSVEVPQRARWHFRDQKRGPNPATLSLIGAGAHPLVEYTNLLNHPINQYRGGQSYVGSLGKSEEAYLWGHVGKSLISTGPGQGAEADIGTRKGANFTIGGFPAKMTVMGLAVFVDNNPSNTDTEVKWYSDAGFTALLGSALIPAAHRGLYPVVMNDAAKWQTLAAGALYVQISKPGLAEETEGRLVIFYFPYMGS